MLSRIAKLLDREGGMSQPVNVKVSSRYQIAVPRIARERLKIERGDRLIVDIQDGLLILIPQPEDYVARMAGRHRGVGRAVASAVTIMEVAVRPWQLDRPAVAREYEVLLYYFPNLDVVDITRD